MARANETFELHNLSVGKIYSKESALEAARVLPPINSREITGKTRFHNCVVLFVTLDKQNKEAAHKYNDVFLLDGKQFHWESQSKNTTSTQAIAQIIEGFPTVLFCRVFDKIKGKTQQFVYVGQLEYVTHQSEAPVQILYNVSEFQSEPNPTIHGVYSWHSEQGVEIELPDTAPNLVKRVKNSGQGRLADVKKKKAIEIHAMQVAEAYYQAEGYEVIDTSSNCPYDLECFKGEKFRRVEVKGTMSNGESVYVTSGEVIDANADKCETDLFIVSKIVVGVIGSSGEYITSKGTTKLITNWKPKPENLEPTMYKFSVQEHP